MRRRAFLAGATSGVGLAGAAAPTAAGRLDSGRFSPERSGSKRLDSGRSGEVRAPASTSTPPGGTGSGPPVVDNAGEPEETIVVDVRVVDGSGDPVEGVRVELEDRGGTPDDRFGETGRDGRLRFLESVGPPPCNSQTLKLPGYGLQADLGCNDGGTTLARTFTVEAGRSPAPALDRSPATPIDRSTPPASKDTSRSPVPPRDDARADGRSWLGGWVLLASWILGVTLLVPLVLGGFVAAVGVTGALGARRESADRADGADADGADGADADGTDGTDTGGMGAGGEEGTDADGADAGGTGSEGGGGTGGSGR